MNVCRGLTNLYLRKEFGQDYEAQLRELDALEEPTTREYEMLIGRWLAKSATIGAVLVLPLTWLVSRFAEQLIVLLVVLLLFLPIAAVISMLEIRVRSVLHTLTKDKKFLPQNRTWLLRPGALMLSSLLSYGAAVALYFFIEPAFAASST